MKIYREKQNIFVKIENKDNIMVRISKDRQYEICLGWNEEEYKKSLYIN